MPTIKLKPTTPSRRQMTLPTFEELTKFSPEKSLVVIKKKNAGRNANGKITVRHRGGGNKQKYRIIDFRRLNEAPAKVIGIEYDPNRTAYIALLQTEAGEKSYVIAPVGLNAGDTVYCGADADIKPGNTLPVANIPVGTVIYNIELYPGKGRYGYNRQRSLLHQHLLQVLLHVPDHFRHYKGSVLSAFFSSGL